MKTIKLERRIAIDKAIAYFMGWRIDNSFPDKGKVWRKGNSVEMESTFKFSTDWNWLMDVFQHINSIEGYSVYINAGCCSVYYNEQLKWESMCKNNMSLHEALYECIGRFVEWYNAEQIQKNNVGA